MHAQNITFKDMTSIPLLSETALHYQGVGNGIFKIGSLPPRSQTTVTSSLRVDPTTKMDGLNLMTYIRSDDAVGFHDTILTIIAYSLYVFILTLYSVTTLIKPKDKKDNTSSGKEKDKGYSDQN
jgi:hypothetical protein